MRVEDNQGFHLKKELGSADLARLGQSGDPILKINKTLNTYYYMPYSALLDNVRTRINLSYFNF